VVGKYAGLVLTLAVNLSVMAIALYAVLAYMSWGASARLIASWERPALDALLLRAFFLTFVELAFVTAIALFFSTFSTPLLSAALTFGFFVAGRFSADLRNFDQAVNSPVAAWFAKALYWVLPNLGSFDVRSQVVHGQPVTAGYMALVTGYGALYIAALLIAATVIFSRRDFK
jgi:ABC-type transport system involved in multi-copper enzyme maturation permease subunit